MPELIIESKANGTFIVHYDNCDSQLIESHTWYIQKRKNTFYIITVIPHPDGGWREWTNPKTGKVERKRRTTTLALHRLIMNPPKGMMVDHINGDGLDNRRANLRVCTNAENGRNQRLSKNNKSGYKGVSWFKRDKKWRSKIKHEGKSRCIGLFDCPEKAARAYDAVAKELFGEYANLNFPEE
jgi:hypothetical protein